MEQINKEYIQICRTCKLKFPLTNEYFYNSSHSASGLGYSCKECSRSAANKFNFNNNELVNKKRRDRYAKLSPEEKKIKNRKETLRRGSRKESRRHKYKNDINFRLRMCLSSRLTDALKRKNNKKFSKTVNMLGASISFVKKYLESQFTEGMTWDKYGYGDNKFHIDHIIPCSAFDLSIEENQKICFNWVNLKPSWHTDNLSKNDFMPNNKRVSECCQEELDFYINELKEKIHKYVR